MILPHPGDPAVVVCCPDWTAEGLCVLNHGAELVHHIFFTILTDPVLAEQNRTL